MDNLKFVAVLVKLSQTMGYMRGTCVDRLHDGGEIANSVCSTQGAQAGTCDGTPRVTDISRSRRVKWCQLSTSELEMDHGS